LVVRQEEGTAFDKDGAVHRATGVPQRDPGRRLYTLPMDEATLVAEATSETARTWLAAFGSGAPPDAGKRPPPPPPKGTGPITTTNPQQAADLADKRCLQSLRIACQSAADAQRALGAAQPLGASEVIIEADLAGPMKDGGMLAFRVSETKVSAAAKPLTMAQTLGNALAVGSAITVAVVLGFGAEGKPDLGALLRTLVMQLPEGAAIEARFASLSA
jgi:hypothetical protein